jgi:hypothetical protein
MRDTADVLSSEHAQIIVFAPDGRIEHEVSTEPDAARQYIDEYASRDPAAPLVAAAKHGRLSWRAVPSRTSCFHRSMPGRGRGS